MFFLFFLCFFLYFINVVFFVVVKKTYKITNMMHFSWAKCTKDSISYGQSKCFVAVIIDFI